MRKLALRTLKLINPGSIRIKHHWTDDPLLIDAFKHRGYWYHGRNREKRQIELFHRLVKPGDTVIEVGGHVGYMTLIFSKLVGATGRVVVFEPGTNNLPFIRQNLKSRDNVTLIEKAVSASTGNLEFFEETLSGQNNSLLPNYLRTRDIHLGSGVKGIGINKTIVESVRLDDVLPPANQDSLSFAKIDVEGAELQVLQGMQGLLDRSNLAMMVEVTHDNKQVFDLLSSYGYELYSLAGKVTNPQDCTEDIFAVKGDDPRRQVIVKALGERGMC